MADARPHTLRRLELTELAEGSDVSSVDIVVEAYGEREEYSTKPYELAEGTNGQPKTGWNLFPVVLCGDGSPWPEATLHILDLLELDYAPDMSSYSNRASDLAYYRRFLEERSIDWTSFPKDKGRRPTYRFKAHLNSLVLSGDMARSYANRKIRTVVQFYRRLAKDRHLIPEHSAWIEKTVTVSFSGESGQKLSKQIQSTDLSLPESRAKNPYEDFIQDDGNIQPLTLEQQKAVLQALTALQNTEMTLGHHLGLFTGARIQSVFTLRKGHFKVAPSAINRNFFPIAAGPGTGIDTKRNKTGVILVPKWLYIAIYTYLKSDRWKSRAEKHYLGLSDDQFVFLSQRGASLYTTKEEILKGRIREDLQSAKTGQGVRAFMAERVIPLAREILADPQFNYKYHDLRGSFGLNFLEFKEPEIASSETTREKVLQELASLLWHDSTEVTERYVKYRSRKNAAREANDGWFEYLERIAANGL